MVRGLVEDEQRRCPRTAEHTGEGGTQLLAAAQRARGLERGLVREKKACERVAHSRLVEVRMSCAKVVEDRQRRIESGTVLVEERDLVIAYASHRSGCGRQPPGGDVQQRRLAAAVRPCDRDALGPDDAQRKTIEYGTFGARKPHGDRVELEHCTPGRKPAGGEIETRTCALLHATSCVRQPLPPLLDLALRHRTDPRASGLRL